MRVVAAVLAGALWLGGCGPATGTGADTTTPRAEKIAATEPGEAAANQESLRSAAQRMIGASERALAPVYAPLAEEMVHALDIADLHGVGIDVGSGPGTLVLELCRRTRLHWINADLNPHFFAYFYRQANSHGVAHRVSAVLADAQNLPFRRDFADVVVSRGSYHFWPDRRRGFREILRVLKPGGVGYVGRGFSRNLPPATARRIRAGQGKGMVYDRRKEADALGRLLRDLGATDVRVHLPSPAGSGELNYGVWVQFRKAPAVRDARGEGGGCE